MSRLLQPRSRLSSAVEWVKPAAAPRARLLVASLVWSLVGAGLTFAGGRWLLAADLPWVVVGLAAAALLGVLKGRLVIGRRARANAERILAAEGRRCLGGCFSWTMWSTTIGMMGLGLALRESELPEPWLGTIYLTAGLALLVGSWSSWSRWYTANRLPE